MARFSAIQIYLHWLTLLLVAITYSAMELKGYLPDPSPWYDFSKTLHFSAGILVWIVMFIRLGLRHRYADPAIIPPPPAWQMLLAKLMHAALYLTFLALPLLGILTLTYGGKSWTLLGIDIPQLMERSGATARTLKTIHETWANIGYFLIAGHAAAAIWHHLIQKDNTLRRMIPGK